MKNLTLFLLLAVLFLIGCKQSIEEKIEKSNLDEPIYGERIDGPANIRDTINGKIIFQIEDNELVECSEIKDNWHQVGLFVSLSKQQFESGIIRKDEKIIHEEKLICTAKEDLDLWMINENDGKDGKEYFGVIGGFTHKKNIKPNSIVERALEKVINANNKLTKEKFEKHLAAFVYKRGGLNIEGYEKVEQFHIYGPWIDDPSPIDRIRLIFEANELIAIIHERPLKMKNKTSYELTRGLELLVIKNFDTKELTTFIEANKKSYWGVD